MFGLANVPLGNINSTLHKVEGTPANNIDWYEAGVITDVKD